MRKNASILFLLKCIKIPLSILLLSLTAKYFGVSIGREVWLLTFSTIMAIDVAFWAPINEIFRAKFIFIKEKEGEEKAINYTQSLLFYIFSFSLIAMLFLMLLPQFFASIIAPNYNHEAFDLLKTMLIYAAPVLLFNQLVQIGNSILNAYEIFFVTEISGAINIIINIVLLIILTPFFGVYALLISYFATIFINLIFIFYYILNKKIPLFKLNWNYSFDGFKIYFIYAIPLFFSYFLGQISTIIEKALATTLSTGSVSIIDYANKIPTMMYVVVINIIITILMPKLAKNHSKNEGSEYMKSFQEIYQLGFIFLAFVIVFIIGTSEPLITILYQSKNISIIDLNKIIILSKYYSVCLIAIFLYSIFGMSMVASLKNKAYAIIAIITQFIVIALNFAFIKWLDIFVFPVVFAFAHTIGAFLMYKKFPYKDNNIGKTTLKYLLYILITSLIMIFAKNMITFANLYLNIMWLCTLQIFIMITIMYAMKIEELEISISKIKEFINKNKIK